MGYVVLSFGKMKSYHQIGGLDGHIKREFNTDNVDLSESYKNKTLISTNGYTLNEAWERRMQEVTAEFGKRPFRRNNSVMILEVVTGISHGQKGLDLNAWADKNIEWLKKTFGEKNILCSTLHMDETSPHIHTEIIPITSDGRLCARDFTAGKWAMTKLRNSYASEMAEFGLERGEKKSKAKKQSLNKFYNAVENAENAKLPPIRPMEGVDEYIERMEKYLKTLKMENLKLQNELIQTNAVHSARMSQAFSKYTDAVALYDELYEKFDGDEEMVKERLCQYRRLEFGVPRMSLQNVLNGLEDKFPAQENAAVMFLDEKKKKRLGLDGDTETIEIDEE